MHVLCPLRWVCDPVRQWETRILHRHHHWTGHWYDFSIQSFFCDEKEKFVLFSSCPLVSFSCARYWRVQGNPRSVWEWSVHQHDWQLQVWVPHWLHLQRQAVDLRRYSKAYHTHWSSTESDAKMENAVNYSLVFKLKAFTHPGALFVLV